MEHQHYNKQEHKTDEEISQEPEQQSVEEIDQDQGQESDEEVHREQRQKSHEERHQEQGQNSAGELHQKQEQESDWEPDEEEENDSDDGGEGLSDETFHRGRRGLERENMKQRTLKNSGIYSCPECSKCFQSQWSLSKHRRSHKLTCVVCDQTFRLSVEFEGHMREHEGEEAPYWCDKCDKKYPKLVTLKRHRINCGRFECSECGKVFVRRYSFREHMAVHFGSNSSMCKICGKQLSCASAKRVHMVMHREETPYQCVVCDERFKYKRNIDYHMTKHTGAPNKYLDKIDCVVCGKTLKGINSLRSHMDVHKGKKGYECSVCGRRFAQSSSRDGHERTHYYKRIRSKDCPSVNQLKDNIFNSFDCSDCFLSFTKNPFLIHHRQSVHKVKPTADETPSKSFGFQCRLCCKTVKSPRKLNAHYLDEHCQINHSSSTQCGKVTTPGSKISCGFASLPPKLNDRIACPSVQYVCKLCNKTVISTSVANHMRNHAEKKFVCRVCGKTFIQTANLKRHMTLHTNEKPYACVACDQTFRTHKFLQRHKTTHQRNKKTELIKKFGCDTCGKMFVDNYHLNRHKITHMEKYRCDKCNRSFVDLTIYEKHLQSHSSA